MPFFPFPTELYEWRSRLPWSLRGFKPVPVLSEAQALLSGPVSRSRSREYLFLSVGTSTLSTACSILSHLVSSATKRSSLNSDLSRHSLMMTSVLLLPLWVQAQPLLALSYLYLRILFLSLLASTEPPIEPFLARRHLIYPSHRWKTDRVLPSTEARFATPCWKSAILTISLRVAASESWFQSLSVLATRNIGPSHELRSKFLTEVLITI